MLSRDITIYVYVCKACASFGPRIFGRAQQTKKFAGTMLPLMRKPNHVFGPPMGAESSQEHRLHVCKASEIEYPHTHSRKRGRDTKGPE